MQVPPSPGRLRTVLQRPDQKNGADSSNPGWGGKSNPGVDVFFHGETSEYPSDISVRRIDQQEV